MLRRCSFTRVQKEEKLLDLLIDFNSFLVLLQLSCIGGHFQQTFVGRAAGRKGKRIGGNWARENQQLLFPTCQHKTPSCPPGQHQDSQSSQGPNAIYANMSLKSSLNGRRLGLHFPPKAFSLTSLERLRVDLHLSKARTDITMKVSRKCS